MTSPHPNSLLLQLRARECVRLWSHGGAASHHALPLSRSAPHRITDELDAASICATALRSKSSANLPQHILLGHTGCVNAVAVSDGATSHGRWIASAGDDERVLLWDAYLPVLEVHANSGHTIRSIQLGRTGAHEPHTLDSDVASASSRSSSASAGSIHRGFARAFGGHSANIFGLQFTPDSRRIVSCGLDAGILMYDIETGGTTENGGRLRAPIRSFTGHESSVHRTSFIKDSSDVFLSASNDHTCRLFDARASGSRAQLVGGLGYSLNSVHCSPTDEHAFVTAGKALCLHDLRQMHASKPAAPPPTTRSAMGRAQQLARTALALRRGQMPPEEDEDAGEEGAGEAGSDSDDESEFNAIMRIMLSGRSSARATPIAVVQSFDLTTLTPPVGPSVSTRAEAAGARGSARGRGATRGARGRGAARSRGRGRGAAAAGAASSSTADAAAPSAGRTRSRGRGGRGRGSARAPTTAEEAPADDDEMPESDRRASEAADSAAAAPRRSSRNRPAEPAVEVKDEDDDADEAEAPSSFPTPNERRRERLAQLSPPREASSCEYSSDGRFVLACMMKATPLLFDVTRTQPVLSMQSRGTFSGYSHTCTLKSAVFAGPDDRFVIAGSDNFGIFVWDRTLQREDILGISDGVGAAAASSAASSLSVSAASSSSSSTTFLNACKILRGHRSIPNNQRFHPQLMQILSCGVEKVVRVFNCNRVPVDLHQREREAEEPAGAERVAGDVIPAEEAQRLLRLEHIPTQAASQTDAVAPAAASSASAHKRAASDKLAAQPEEKKARSQRESSSAMVDEQDSKTASSTAASAAASSSASAGASSSAGSSSAAVPSASSDPLYRMVKTYSTVRNPYTRLQCAYLLSGGAAVFGAAAAMFADAEAEELAAVRGGPDEPDPRSSDSMAEDRACLAQFDFYVSRSVAGEPSDGDSDSEDNFGIENVSSSEGDDDDAAARAEAGDTETHHTFLDLNSDEERRMREALNMDDEDDDDGDEAEEA